ncbi:MAG: aminotransferase, partial [Actinomycetota bacterium]
KRDVLVAALGEAGLVAHRTEGTYFVTADIRARRTDGDAMAFCRSLPGEAGIVAIPASVLYDPRHADEGRHLVRFAFCKQMPTIETAAERLHAWGSRSRVDR